MLFKLRNIGEVEKSRGRLKFLQKSGLPKSRTSTEIERLSNFKSPTFRVQKVIPPLVKKLVGAHDFHTLPAKILYRPIYDRLAIFVKHM